LPDALMGDFGVRARALPVDECGSVWPACPELRREISPRWGVMWGAKGYA
jgi:hypothetical protein